MTRMIDEAVVHFAKMRSRTTRPGLSDMVAAIRAALSESSWRQILPQTAAYLDALAGNCQADAEGNQAGMSHESFQEWLAALAQFERPVAPAGGFIGSCVCDSIDPGAARLPVAAQFPEQGDLTGSSGPKLRRSKTHRQRWWR